MAREDVERLVRIETKLDAVLMRADEDRRAVEAEITQVRDEHQRDVVELKDEHSRDIGEVKNEATDLTKRVNSLENWRYAIGAALILGAGSTVTAATSFIASAPK